MASEKSDRGSPILRQFDINAGKNLLYDRLEQIMEVDPLFLAALEESRAGAHDGPGSPALDATAGQAARILVERMREINQFVTVDDEAMDALTGIYRRTWETLREGGDVESILRTVHYPALRDWIAGVYPREIAEGLRSSPRIGRVTCGEYSPAMQCAALRLDPDTLLPPVLDIGCGRGAALVRHLRARGVTAFGIDRRIADPEPWLEEADWMGYLFTPGAWGTVVSNMAFSNHALYARRFEPGRWSSYASKYREILASLAPGGSFHYAPSVPDLEEELSSGLYVIRAFMVVSEVHASQVTRRP